MITITRFFALLASCLLLAAPAFADDTVALSVETKPAPAILFKDGQGIHPLNAQQNRLTAVHFWATWCAPCIAELPEVDAAAQAYGDKGLKIVAISLDGDESMDKVKQFYAEHKIIHLKPYLDFGNVSFKNTALKGLPGTIFINSENQEIARAEGPLDWKKAETVAFIEKALK